MSAEPNLEYWKGDLLRRTYRFFRPDDLGAQHFVYYTQRSLCALLEASGFNVRVAGKDFYRRKLASRSWRHALVEAARFAALRAAMSFVRALRFQRELFLIAEKAPDLGLARRRAR